MVGERQGPGMEKGGNGVSSGGHRKQGVQSRNRFASERVKPWSMVRREMEEHQHSD